MDIESIIKAITDYTKELYAVEFQDSNCKQINDLAPRALNRNAVLRLTRIPSTANPRTIILSIIENSEDIVNLLKWGASAKEELLDPEAADLYLIGIMDSPFLSFEECLNIEAGEQFCRRYILRPGETLEAMLSRTFLGPVESIMSSESLSDPLRQAIVNTAKQHSWMTEEDQEKWRNAFLSGKGGNELIDLLFQIDPIKE